MEGESKRETIWSVPFIILTAANFFSSMSAFTTNVTIPLYADHLGAGAGLIGIIVGAFAMTSILFRPFVTPAFDSMSRKRLFIAAQVLMVLVFFLYSMVSTWPALLAVRLVHGLAMGIVGPLAMSLVSEYLPLSKMASGVGVYTVAQSVAQVIGPALGLWFVDALGYRFTYLIAAVLILISAVSILFVREVPREKPPYQLRLDRMFAKEALSTGAVLALFAIAFSGDTTYIVLYGVQLGVGTLSQYFVICALCLIVTRPLLGKLGDRYGAEIVLIGGMMCLIISEVILANASALWHFIVVAVVSSAGFGACAPLVISRAMAHTPIERRGAVASTAYMGLDIGCLVGPIFAGYAIEVLTKVTGSELGGYTYMWYVMIVPAVIALLIIIKWALAARTKSAPEVQ